MAIPNFDEWEPDLQTPQTPKPQVPKFDDWVQGQQFAPLDNLKSFAAQNQLEVGSTTGGRHNRGSKHYTGRAIDIRNSGTLDDIRVQELSNAAAKAGLKLRDERRRPRGQLVWGGPHIHLETADEPQIPKFDDWIKTTEQSPPRPSTAETTLKITPRATTAPLQPESLILPRGQRNQGAAYRPTFKGTPPTPTQVLADIGSKTTALTELIKEQDRASKTGAGGLRRIDDPETQRILRTQQAQANLNPVLAKVRAGQLTSSQARQAAQKASTEQAAEFQRQKDEPEIQALTDAYRADIQKQGLPSWLTETLSRGGAGIGEFGVGVGKLFAPLTRDPEAAKERIDTLRKHAEAMTRAAVAEGADRNVVSRTIQDATAGFIASTPEFAAMLVGAPPIGTFGAGSGIRAIGRGEDTEDVMKSTAHGLATGAAFEAPVPKQLQNPLARAGTKGATVGGATAAIDLASGATPQQAIASGLTNAVFAGHGELTKAGAERAQTEQRRARIGQRLEDIPATEGLRLPEPIQKETNEPQIQTKPTVEAQRETAERQPPMVTPLSEPVPEGYVRFYRVQHETGTEPSGTHWATDLPYIQQKYGSGGREAIWSRDIKKSDLDEWFNDWRTVPILTKVDLDRLANVQPPVLRKKADAATVIQEGSPSRFYHRDYGEVTEAPNQRKAGRGRIKVLDSEGKEHFVKRADLSGRGNQRMVPLKSEPENVGEVGGVNSASPSASSATETVTETSAQKAAIDIERARRGAEPLPFSPESKSDQQLLEDAQRANAAKPQEPQRLVQEVLNQPRALSDKETVQLDLYKQQLKNEHSDLMKQIETATDPEQIKSLRARSDAIESEFDAVDRAWRKSGTEKGRSLRSQQITINQDYDLVSMKTRLKAAKGEPLDAKETADVEVLHKRIAELESRVTEAEANALKQQADRQVVKIRRQRSRAETKVSLDEAAIVIRQNIANELARIRSGSMRPSGLAGLDPEGKLTKELIKYVHNRAKANLQLPLEALIDEAHDLVKDIGASRRQVMEAIVGYGKQSQSRSPEAKRLTEINSEINRILKEQDVAGGKRSTKQEGPKRDYQRNQTRLRQLEKQRAEYERRVAEKDFGPRTKRPSLTPTPEVEAAQAEVQRAKNQFLRKEREFKLAGRGPAERAADFLIRWGRAAKLSYVSTLGKLSGAATGRMAISPIENLLGEIPHRLSLELSRRATTEGGGFDLPAEIAALWKSGRFKQVLNQITKGSSDLDVLYGKGKSLDKEMSSEGVLGMPGRVHGALKEYPRQAEFDRAFIKVLRNYERTGKDIIDPQVQLAAKMEAYSSAERARFQQRNFISDVFNEAMGSLERKGGLAKGVSKAGRFVFPITRVPVNVAGETLNYTLGLPRAAIETAIRGGVKNLTTEQANNIMRAYKKGGVGLAVMLYAYFHPQQFGGYYQKGDQRKDDEPHFGEVMFFGHRIPKWATHIPIIEAGQLAATVRRVSDKLREKGEDKGEATLGGVTAGAKGVASGIPFYETPARFFTGQEGARGWAEVVGQQGKGMIPGFIQEGAQLLDKDAQGNPIKRRPSGSFAQRVGQTVEMGIPGLRSRVPLNEKAIKSDRKSELIEQYRQGKIGNADLEYDESLTPADRSAIRKAGQVGEKQARFDNYAAATALDRFERMDEAAREDVREQMEKKAWTLTHSDTLTEQQKAEFRERLDKLGVVPRRPKKSANSFKDLFKQSASLF